MCIRDRFLFKSISDSVCVQWISVAGFLRTRCSILTLTGVGLPKALAADLLKRQTGLPLAQNYWRLREGKGLLNIFDQTSLDMWSKLISDIRRFTGSPVALPNRFMDDIRAEREQLLKRMEQYRTWLSQGTSPVYHYDCYQHGGCVYRRQALELALSSWLKDKGMDLTEPPDSCLWTMSASDREAWRQRPRSLVDRILREQLIAWQEVYQEASQICAEIQRVIDRTEQSRRRCEAVLQDERSSETEKTEAVRILDEVNRVNPLIDSGVMNKRNFFYIDEIWQIRTDMDNRSSIDAAINALLLWIGDIPSLTAEHRLIYRQDQDKVNAYKEWKSLMRKQFSTSKEKHGSYDAAAIAEEIRTTIKTVSYTHLTLPTSDLV